MIAAITGRLTHRGADHLIIDVGGIGYQVHVPLSTVLRLPCDARDVSLHVHTHLREDAITLFGFLTPEEKGLFQMLLGVSGIGPKLALAVLSSLTVDDVVCAIRSSDESRLCSIPGVGRKTAGRIVLELRDRINTLVAPKEAPGTGRGTALVVDDAASALVNLGYKKGQAEEVLKRIVNSRREVTLPELIREALHLLTQR